jgi:hypothetical protein
LAREIYDATLVSRGWATSEDHLPGLSGRLLAIVLEVLPELRPGPTQVATHENLIPACECIVNDAVVIGGSASQYTGLEVLLKKIAMLT